MGPKSQKFEAYCNMTTNETCIQGHPIVFEAIQFRKGEFWLSSHQQSDLLWGLYRVSCFDRFVYIFDYSLYPPLC